MEILKHGRKTTCTCTKCHSELRWNDSDLKVARDSGKCFGPYEIDIEPEDWYDVYVVCPVCPGTKIYVNIGFDHKCSLVKALRN